jgi:hypothetical protein
MTEALEMPLQLVDHEAVELGEALDERSRPRGAPEQLVEPIGVVPEHRGIDERSAQLLDVRFLGSQPLRQHLDERSDLVEMSIGQRDEQRILVREVLVQRSDRDLGGFGHLVRRRRVVPALVENASSLVQDTGVERPRPLLNRSFAGRPWKVRGRTTTPTCSSPTNTVAWSAPGDTSWSSHRSTTPRAGTPIASTSTQGS